MYDLFSDRKYDELLKCCSEILERDPQNILALKHKAYSFYFLKLYEKALLCYDMVIKLEPDNPSNYSAKSRMLERLGRFDEAKSCYEKALKLKDQSNLGHDKNEWGKLEMGKKWKNCGKEHLDPHLTYFSDKCLFVSVKKSKPFSRKKLKRIKC